MELKRQLSWAKTHGGGTAKVAGACSKLNEYMSIQRMFLERDKSRVNWADVVEYLERNTSLPQHEFWTLLGPGDKCAMVESAKRIASSGGTLMPLMLSSFPGQECIVVLLNGHVHMSEGKTENIQHVFSAGSVFGQLEAFSPDETIAYRGDIHEVDPGDGLRMKSGQALLIHKADALRAIRIARYGPKLVSEEIDSDTWTPDSLAKRHLPDALYQLLLPKLYQMPREELSQWQTGEALFEPGDNDDMLYVILQGLVELTIPIQPTRTQPTAAPARPESRVPTELTELTYPSIACASSHGVVSVRLRTIPIVHAGAGVVISSTGVVEFEPRTPTGERAVAEQCVMSAVAKAPCVVLKISRKNVRTLYRDAPRPLQRKVVKAFESANAWLQEKLSRAMLTSSEGHLFTMKAKQTVNGETRENQQHAALEAVSQDTQNAVLFQPPLKPTGRQPFEELEVKPEAGLTLPRIVPSPTASEGR